ncbi:AlpA family phage regulatory protein [Rhizobium sp. P38BS-XIX]|nr:AlpA family phage regulatory protein [Rhizobium sp. P38BS-XIX]
MQSLIESLSSKPDDSLIRMPEFLRYIPVSRSTTYAKIRAGVWPAPLKISERVVAFRVSDVRALLERFERGEAQ